MELGRPAQLWLVLVTQPPACYGHACPGSESTSTFLNRCTSMGGKLSWRGCVIAEAELSATYSGL